MEGGAPAQNVYMKPTHYALPPRQGVEEILQENQIEATDNTADQQVYQQQYQYYQEQQQYQESGAGDQADMLNFIQNDYGGVQTQPTGYSEGEYYQQQQQYQENGGFYSQDGQHAAEARSSLQLDVKQVEDEDN